MTLLTESLRNLPQRHILERGLLKSIVQHIDGLLGFLNVRGIAVIDQPFCGSVALGRLGSQVTESGSSPGIEARNGGNIAAQCSVGEAARATTLGAATLLPT